MNRSIKLILVFVATITLAAAQSTKVADPPELVALREQHLRTIHKAVAPHLASYARSLEFQKSQFTRQGKLEAALAVDKELKEIAQQIENARAAAASVVPIQLTIISAKYGNGNDRMVDITNHVKTALSTGKSSIDLTSTLAGGDPAPYQRKLTYITYAINGKKKEKTFSEGHRLNFNQDLE